MLNKLNEKNPLVYLDSNSFYFLNYLIFGDKDYCVNVDSNSDVNYSKLRLLANDILNKKVMIALTPATIAEILLHNYTDKNKTTQYFKNINNYIVSNHLIIGFRSYEPFFKKGDFDLIEIFDAANNCCFSDSYLLEKLEIKIDYESEILCVYFNLLILFFIFCVVGEVYKKTTLNFSDLKKSLSFIISIKPNIKTVISDILRDGYSTGTEKKIIQKNYNKILNEAIGEYITYLKPENEFNIQITSALMLAIKNPVKLLRNIYLKEYKKCIAPESVEKYEEYNKTIFKNVCKNKNYSDAQCEYLSSMVCDFYKCNRLFEKNNTEDFWILFVSDKDNNLLTYDSKMREFIRKENPSNANFIDSYSNKHI